jgi:Aldose 1-epimerase
MQVYTGNSLAGELVGTGGEAYHEGAGFALETQHFPDSPHHIGDPAWPSVVLRPGRDLRTRTTYRFGVAGPEFADRVRFSRCRRARRGLARPFWRPRPAPRAQLDNWRPRAGPCRAMHAYGA